MNTKRLLTLVAFFATLQASAQQVNPVPDYVFRNQMSVGRGTVTDTAAYFSIGPRYGANKGFMPPIVVDTATFSSGKRNGLLIFSVQKNKFLYWDSVRVQWSDMAGSSGSYIVAGDTASMLTPYVRHAGYGLTKSGQSFLVDTLNIATRAWRQKGLDSLAALEVSGSGTTNYVPKFTASSTIGNSIIQDNGTDVGIGSNSAGARLEILRTATGAANNNTTGSVFGSLHGSGGGPSAYGFAIRHNGSAYAGISGSNFVAQLVSSSTNSNALEMYTTGSTPLVLGTSATERLRITSGGAMYFKGASTTTDAQADIENDNTALYLFGSLSGSVNKEIRMYFNGTSSGERFRMFNNGRVFIGASPTDAGYQLDVNGTLRSVNGANFATTSGNVGIGTASPAYKFHTLTSDATIAAFRNSGAANGQILIGNTAGDLSIRTLSTGDSYIFSDAGKYLDFGSNASFRMRLTSDGELLVSTTSDAGDYKLQVSGNIYNTGSAVLAATSGNVGIGTASPATYAGYTTLAVNNATNGGVIDIMRNNSVVLQIFGDAGASGIGSLANVPFTFKTNSIEQGRINTAGEFLLNSTNSDAGDYKLQVSGNIYNTGSAVLAATSGNVGVGVTPSAWGLGKAVEVKSEGNSIWSYDIENMFVTNNAYFNGGWKYGKNGKASTYTQFQGQHFWDIAGTGTAGNAITFTTAMAINGAGETLINTTTDAGNYKLQVSGQAFIRNTATSGALYLDSTSLSIYEVKNRHAILISGHSLTGAEIQGPIYVGTNWNTSSDVSAIEVALTNTASGANSNLMKLSDGTNTFRVTKDAGIFTAAPSGGTARKWKLGSVVATSVILDTANYVEVEINGVAYKLALVTPN